MKHLFVFSILMFASTLARAMDQKTVDGLNSLIASNPAYLDYTIQDVCVDASNQVIAGDPATCSLHRNVRIGEKVPYIVTDFDRVNNNTTYQGLFSYPVPGADGSLKVLTLKSNQGGFNSAYTFTNFSVSRDGYDLMDVSSTYNSFIRTSDGGCYDQEMASSTTRTGGWVLFQNNIQAGQSVHGINVTRISSNVPSSCGTYKSVSQSDKALDVWNNPVGVTYESGKSLQSIVTYHYAAQDLTTKDNALERYFFTREYGFTRWEAWLPLSRCLSDYASTPERCSITSQKNILIGRCGPTAPLPGTAIWGNQSWVRVDCRDSTNYIALSTAQIPLLNMPGGNSPLAENDGLKDLDSASVFAAAARGPSALAAGAALVTTAAQTQASAMLTPTGSYSQSCSSCTVSGNSLSCSCKNKNGKLVSTSLAFGSCQGSIGNNDGTLTCSGVTSSATCSGNCPLPAGPYAQSCQSCSATLSQLTCQCKNTRGDYISTQLSYQGCTSGVNNSNGTLRCDGVN